MNKLAFLIMVGCTIAVLWIIDFFTLFIVIAACGYYRYLVVQNKRGKLGEFNQGVYKYFELIGKYAVIGIDSIISMFF